VHLLYGAVDIVEDVVQCRRETGDLFRFERCDERHVQLLEDLVRDVVSLVLELLHAGTLLFHVFIVLDELHEMIGCNDDRPGHSVEEIEKDLILRDYPLLDAHN